MACSGVKVSAGSVVRQGIQGRNHKVLSGFGCHEKAGINANVFIYFKKKMREVFQLWKF